jgi:AcrR family transcriptional regulator
LNAALEVFSEVGFDAATTKAISRRAGLNESLIQRYFQSKAGLLEAIIDEYTKARYNDAYPTGKSLEDEIYNYLVNQYETDTKNPNFVRVAFHNVLNNPRFLKNIETKYHSPENLISRLKFLQANGQIKAGVDLDLLAQIICSQSFVLGIMERAILGFDNTNTYRQKFKFFARALAQGVGNKK